MKRLLDLSILLAAIWQQHPDFAKADALLAGRHRTGYPITERLRSVRERRTTP
jgi:hypothetical protein